MSSALEKQIKEFQKKGANKRCFICGQKGPQYFVMNYLILVCNGCAGVCREFSFPCKHATLTSWTKEEVAKILEGGNKKAEKKLLKGWNEKKNPRPASSDKEGVRNFISKALQEKAWAKASKVVSEDEDDEEEEEEEEYIPKKAAKKPAKKPVVVSDEEEEEEDDEDFAPKKPVKKAAKKPVKKPAAVSDEEEEEDDEDFAPKKPVKKAAKKPVKKAVKKPAAVSDEEEEEEEERPARGRRGKKVTKKAAKAESNDDLLDIFGAAPAEPAEEPDWDNVGAQQDAPKKGGDDFSALEEIAAADKMASIQAAMKKQAEEEEAKNLWASSSYSP